jgi:hypothetical protein
MTFPESGESTWIYSVSMCFISALARQPFTEEVKNRKIAGLIASPPPSSCLIDTHRREAKRAWLAEHFSPAGPNESVVHVEYQQGQHIIC